MNVINEIDIESFRNIFEKQIKDKLKIKKQCKALLKNGDRCSNCPKDDEMTCKTHENSKKIIKSNKIIIYHNHLPFEKCNNCPLSVK